MKKYKFLIYGMILIIVILLCSTPLASSRYESTIKGTVKNDVAIYLLKAQYEVIDVKLPTLKPSVTPYIYRFSISNNDGEKRTEVNLEYDLTLRTTTNLPLDFELYLNEDYENENATNIFLGKVIEPDEDGTIFQKISIPTRYFGYTQNEIDNYTLVVWFPLIDENKNFKYQDLLESIEISVKSKQILSSDNN